MLLTYVSIDTDLRYNDDVFFDFDLMLLTYTDLMYNEDVSQLVPFTCSNVDEDDVLSQQLLVQPYLLSTNLQCR